MGLPAPRQREGLTESQAEKVLFLSLFPLVHLALARPTPLKRLKQLVEGAYFREARNRGWTQREVAERMSISEPKVALLARQLREFFSESEAGETLGRRVLALLRSGPLSRMRLAQFLGEVDDEGLDRALESLVERKLVEPIKMDRAVVRYRLATGEFRQGHDEWSKKLDGLGSFLRSVGRLVKARFFDDDERAAVRRLDFRIRPEDVPKLFAFYEQQLLPLVRQLDEDAEGAPESMPIEVAMHWVPGSEKE